MDFQNIAGRNPVLEVLKTDKQVDKIFVLKGDLQGSINKIIGIAKDRNILLQEVDKKKLDFLAEGANHQGVVAQVTSYQYFIKSKKRE